MLGQILGKLLGGGGGRAPGSRIAVRIPDLPDLDRAFDALEHHVDEMGEGLEDLSMAELKSRLGEQETLSRLGDQLCAALDAAGTLSLDQATAAAGRATSVVRLAGRCKRYPRPFSDINCLPIAPVFDVLAVTVERHGIDRALHDALLIFASAISNALINETESLAEAMAELASRYQEPEEVQHDAARLVETYLLEAMVRQRGLGNDMKIHDLPAGKRIVDSAPEILRDVLIETFRVLAEAIVDNAQALKKEFNTSEWYNRSSLKCDHAGNLAARLLRRRIPLTEGQIANMFALMLRPGKGWLHQWPVVPLVGVTEKFVEANGLGPELRAALKTLLRVTGGRIWGNADERLERLLGTADKKLIIPHSALGLAITGWVNAQDETVKKLWLGLMQLGLQTAGKAKPVAKWSGLAAGIVERIGEDEIVERLSGWLKDPGITTDGPEPNGDIVKGMIWAVAKGGDDKLASVLGRLCETCYKKVPGVGPANVKLGNACIYALGEMHGERAVAELVRLRSRIKFNQGRKQLDKALGEAAEHAGLTIADLEEIALPTFGLDEDGARWVALGEVTAEIRITGSDEVALSWTGADGKPRKTIPASVKTDHADELKSLRAEIKEIKGLLAGQRWRLESLYLAQRSWPLVDWRKRYLEHPLMANLARRLIWKFGEVAAVPAGEGFVDAAGKAVEPLANATISQWHPIDVEAAEVLAWRRRLAALEITQPFKQAHREIYVLTDAERETETYSNRFAAHVLRQHQMNALCQARGWRYNLQGAWDQEESVPTLHLPNWRISVEFWVNYASEDYLESGVYLYRATDQVRFLNDVDGPIPLDRVPPLVLSEAMRDVDLFVGVASVGNNPEWQDGGPEGRFRDYWHEFSFGDLGETAKTRKAVLEDLLPRLKIAGQCELQDKFLAVRGTKRTYKIHLGSGNILMTPNDQYLCIVPDQSKAAKGGDNLRLPFEGDRTLSLIISKAFLLAADDKITDKTILSQIGR